MIETAMIMAAGYGTRMKPLTNNISKAMVRLNGKPLINHMLQRLVNVGIKKAIVNVHAFAPNLISHLKSLNLDLEIVISDETNLLLETGGGVVKALPMLGQKPILICNIDSIWIEFEPVLEKLINAWKPGHMDELLLCAKAEWSLGYSGKGDFDFGKNNSLIRRSNQKSDYIYAGVQIFKPDLAKSYKVEKFSRNKIWNESLKRKTIYGIQLPGYWMHVGDPKSLIAAEAVINQVKLKGCNEKS